RAADNHQKARAAVEQMLTAVSEEWLAHVPHMELVRQKFLAKALQYYQGVLAEESTNPEAQRETGQAYRRVGDIQQLLGDAAAAERAYDAAVALLQKLVDDAPTGRASRQELAHSHHNHGNLLMSLGRHQEAEQAYRAALTLRVQLVHDGAAEPGCRQEQ